MSTRKVERDLYLLQRTLGDARVAQTGMAPLVNRLLKRKFHRSLFGLLRKGGL